MCGLAGLILADGARPDRSALQRMAAALAHRGPDDHGIHCAGPVGLAQTRLAIIGLADGHQPMVADDGRLALAANGEVYNYPELNRELAALGAIPRTGSDSETILLAYAADGLAGLERLRGMYAFALHDLSAQRLILWRDRLGIKPLFWVRLADRIAFASELKALLAILPQTPPIAPAALRQFLGNQFTTGRDTVFAGIQRVLPGEALLIDYRLQVTHHRHWSPLATAPQRLDDDAAQATLERLLHAAMTEHLRADVPFGLFLSGGLDSAVLAVLLREHGAGRIASFSVGFEGTTATDELDQATGLATHLGFDHRPMRQSVARFMQRLPHTIWATDELMRDYACLPTSLLAEAAGTELKVVFSGEGGDEVFAGYRRYRPTLPERLYKRLRFPGSGGFRARGQWHRHWRHALFGPALAASALPDRAPFVAAWQATPADWSALQCRQYTDLVTALPDNLLVKTDRLLMAFGVEGRVPFLDHRLVEFGLSLPDGLKTRHGRGKWLLREWARPRLPTGYLERPKRGFHVPVGDWLTAAVTKRAGQLLVRNHGIREWFRSERIGALVAARRAGRGGDRELFGLIQFAIWHRLFIDEPGLTPAPDEDPLAWIAAGP